MTQDGTLYFLQWSTVYLTSKAKMNVAEGFPHKINFKYRFVDVVRLSALAINILHTDKNIFHGYLSPTIVQLHCHMNDLLNESLQASAAEGLIIHRYREQGKASEED